MVSITPGKRERAQHGKGKAFGAMELMLPTTPVSSPACPWQARGEGGGAALQMTVLFRNLLPCSLTLSLGPWEAGTGSWHCVSAVPFLFRVGHVPVQYEKQK